MTNVDAGGPLTEPTESSRSKIANRLWIDDAGHEVDEEHATGVQYEFLGRTKDGITIPPDGKSFTQYWKDLNPEAQRMFGLFGQQTLFGNITNTWMGDKADDKAPTAAEAIAARVALLQSGVWIDRTREGVGARVDKDALAQAVVNVLTGAGKVADLATWRAKLEDLDVVKTARSNAAVTAEYASLMGRKVSTLDDLESLVK